MNLLYLGYYVSGSALNGLEKENPELSYASNIFEGTLLSELQRNLNCFDDFTVLSANGLKNIASAMVDNTDCDIPVQYFWYNRSNLFSFFKTVFIAGKRINKWIEKTSGSNAVALCYAVNPVLVLPLMLSAKRKKVKVVSVCSEIPQYRVVDGMKIPGKIKYRLLQLLNEQMDGYIFLSPYMNEVCNRKNKPWITVESLPHIEEEIETVPEAASEKYIMYAGGLNRENGIEMLIEAFSMLNINIKLKLCGAGTAEELVKDAVNKNANIEYLGNLPNDEVRKLEKKAVLLVNPRLPDNRLTRYSFPSKTVEYMLSGTPAAITKLDGIPDEYYDYCYCLNSASAEEMFRSLSEILDIPEKDRLKTAAAAKQFIIDNKSADRQVKRIIAFLTSLQ